MKISIKNIKNWTLAVIFAMVVGGIFASSISLQTVSAAPAPTADCNKGFMGFPAWYRGMTDSECNIKAPGSADGDLGRFIWHIGLNVAEIVLVAVAYISGFYTLFGGFLFITSRGNPEGAANARKTLLNAIIGLIISMVAVIAIDFIVSGLFG